jgi:hypothetical protein
VSAHRRRSRRPAPMVREGATVLRPLSFGPRRRPGAEPQTCVCGIQFTTYWTHRQTTQHTRMVAATRAARRAPFVPGGLVPTDHASILEHMTEPAGEAA